MTCISDIGALYHTPLYLFLMRFERHCIDLNLFALGGVFCGLCFWGKIICANFVFFWIGLAMGEEIWKSKAKRGKRREWVVNIGMVISRFDDE